MHKFNHVGTAGRILMKFGMDVVPLEETPNLYYLIC
jgi:hypothetical protein